MQLVKEKEVLDYNEKDFEKIYGKLDIVLCELIDENEINKISQYADVKFEAVQNYFYNDWEKITRRNLTKLFYLQHTLSKNKSFKGVILRYTPPEQD